MHYVIKYFLVLFVASLAFTVGADAVQQLGLEDDFFSKRVNLALRKTADRLLDLSGDSTSTIQPVQQQRSGTFNIRIENKLAYDSLPKILEKAMTLYGVDYNYLVSLTDCDSGHVLLGYTREDLKTSVPCSGRKIENECFELSLIFPSLPSDREETRYLYYMALIGSFLIGLILYQKLKITSDEERPLLMNENVGQAFGNTLFDATNQLIVIAGTEKKLTYREAKLLSYLLAHKNQLLEREQILSAVWEDEGIMVGRSLDVFVSRLRKLLRADSLLKITNVHGVGYRFEVADQ